MKSSKTWVNANSPDTKLRRGYRGASFVGGAKQDPPTQFYLHCELIFIIDLVLSPAACPAPLRNRLFFGNAIILARQHRLSFALNKRRKTKHFYSSRVMIYDRW
jgi:hypothetical protein